MPILKKVWKRIESTTYIKAKIYDAEQLTSVVYVVIEMKQSYSIYLRTAPHLQDVTKGQF